MVFPGRFSTGCMRCRKRKVKCDERKPSCQRCETYGKDCPGYTDQFHFRSGLTVENFDKSPTKSSSKSPAKSPIKPAPICPIKQEESSPPALEATSGEYENPSQSLISLPPIEHHPTLSYDHISLCYFIRRFVSPNGSDSFPGHLTFLPGLYDHQNHGLLETATLSVAKMAAYNQFGGERFKLESYREYGNTIRMIQAIIQDEAQVTDDKVVASLLLLCTLKDISGDDLGDGDEHAPGLFYLLEKRGFEQLATRRGTELLLLSLLRLQIYSFVRDDDTYSDPGGIATFLAPFNPLFRAMSTMNKTLTLRKRLTVAVTTLESRVMQAHDASLFPIDDPLESTDEDRDIFLACFETLEEFDKWDLEAASYWQDTFEGRALPTALGQVSGASFYDAETACIIILLRSARLTLLLSMLQYHDRMQILHRNYGGSMLAWGECAAILEQDVIKTVDDILFSVPYAFGDIDPSGLPTAIPYDGAAAIVILHSIRLVTYSCYATPEQVRQATDILDRMNARIGIRAAIKVNLGDISAHASMSSPAAFHQAICSGHAAHLPSPPESSTSTEFLCS